MHRETNDERLDILIREAVQQRLEPAGAPSRDVQWQRLRRHLESGRGAKPIRLGPWPLSRLGLAACGLLLLVAVLPLAFSDQLAGTGQRLFGTVAVQEDAAKPALPEAELETARALSVDADPSKRSAEVESAGPDGRGGMDPNPEDGPPAVFITAAGEADPDAEVRNNESEPDAVDIARVPLRVRTGLSLEQARHEVPFKVWFPRDLPAGFDLIDITYEPHSADAGKVILYFDHPDGRYLRIEQELLTAPAQTDTSFGSEGAKTVIVRSCTGQMLVRDENWTVLLWLEDGKRFKMWGQLPPADITRVAESLQGL